MESNRIVLKLWNNNNNCAQSTAVGILKNHNDPSYKIFQTAFTSFGGGMGEGSICGSISGTIAAVSKLLHDKGFEDVIIKDKINDLKNNSKKIFNSQSLDCKVLLKDFQDENGDVNYGHQGRRNRCTFMMNEIVKYADKLLNSSVGN